MAAYIAGDRDAFRDLFAALAPRVHGFFLRTFRDGAVADDLVQQTFLKVHRARDTYRGDGSSVRSWIFAIAARVRLDELRRRKRLAETANEDDLARADEEQAAVAQGERKEEEARSGRAADVQAALSELPESQRVVIQLHRWEGMSFAEIAKTLGTSEGAVKLRAFRGYEHLRARLKGLIGGGRDG
jgi:RNA polymerase sigma-70 factor (ECF subfamily)